LAGSLGVVMLSIEGVLLVVGYQRGLKN
jgi:hypothetical protein